MMAEIDVREWLNQLEAKNAWITHGGGHYFIEFYLGKGEGNFRIRISKAIAEKLTKSKLFKVVGNRWSGVEVTLSFETPTTAQRFQEAVAVDDLVGVPRRGRGR